MASQPESIHRFTVEDYGAMSRAGIFDDDVRMELVDGVLIEMSRSSPRHSSVVEWLTAHFVLAVHSTRRTGCACRTGLRRARMTICRPTSW